MAGKCKIKRALISVSNKSGLVELAHGLESHGIEIISTGGTLKAIRDGGVQVISITSFTGSPEVMGGRVKTLHPKVHGAILYRRDNSDDVRELAELESKGIDLVIVNLYPFEETMARENISEDELIENIDVSNATDIEALKTRLQSVSLDILINNAGIFEPRPFLEVDEAHLDKFLSIGLKGTYFATQAAIPELKKQGGGHVINIGTTLLDHALGGLPITAPMAAKGAIRAITAQLAAEFSKDNIRVNSVAPGIIRTPMHTKDGVDNADSMAGLHLLGRVGETKDIASAVLYLLESDFVTGIELRVDGGYAAGHTLS